MLQEGKAWKMYVYWKTLPKKFISCEEKQV